ncbi:MAG: 50S ribosomal protein L15 [Deltaproteobacteria bacterium RIFCSPHIGHO2_02_FULL_40_11]|nr:MAG: 50S ribosomal protein L15 [Deltaproteobacteria bacterium RIFCSPHIGHO2_02_FULL_40_11]
MITLHQLEQRRHARHKRKRVGRGYGSGRGGHEATRGTKGQKSRTGGSIRPSFEGGQMPLQRRLPKKGFKSLQKKPQIINLERFSKIKENTVIDPTFLEKENFIASKEKFVRILGRGELKHALTIQAHHFSKSAKEKIEKAGGKAEVLRGGN